MLEVDAAALHVLLCATHCFNKTLVGTVVQDNVNPIEPVERAAVMIAKTVHGASGPQMVKRDQLTRLTQMAPKVMAAATAAIEPPERKG